MLIIIIWTAYNFDWTDSLVEGERLECISTVTQVMCVLINIASASEKTRDDITDHDDLLSALATVLVRIYIQWDPSIRTSP